MNEDEDNAVERRRAASAAVLTCADLTDALGRKHRHRAHITGLVSPAPERILFGRVATISFFPTCHAALDPDSRMPEFKVCAAAVRA